MRYADSATLALLRSPLRGLLDRRICALRYAGRRTGRIYTLPVQYARTDGGVVIAVGAADRKSWWRNMRTPMTVKVWLDGAWRDGVAGLVPPAGRAQALAAYRAAFPRVPSDLPFVKVRLTEAVEADEPLRGQQLLTRWTAWVTAGETAGFVIPAVVGAVTASSPASVSVPALLAAGAIEGAVLGAAQAHVLRRAVAGLPSRRWVLRTSAAAVLAYASGLAPSTVAGSLPGPAVAALAALASVMILLSIGTAQWTVLRHHVPHAGRWIAITAGAWLGGLALFFLIATPLWQPGQPLWLVILIGAFAGGLMAATVAVLSGIGLLRLLSGAATSSRGRVRDHVSRPAPAGRDATHRDAGRTR